MDSIADLRVDAKVIEKLICEVLDTGAYCSAHDLSGFEHGQNPDIYTLFCGDSRVQADVFVDSPLNRLFGNEVIGNQVLGIMGSAAYPTSHLTSVKLVNVAGHVSCGAVGAAYRLSQSLSPNVCAASVPDAVAGTIRYLEGLSRSLIRYDAEEAIGEELAPMAQFFANIRPILGEDDGPFYVKYAAANVLLQTSLLMRTPHIRQKVGAGVMAVIGTVYDFVGRLGDRGTVHVVDMNGTGGISGGFMQSLNGYSRNVLPAVEFLKGVNSFK